MARVSQDKSGRARSITEQHEENEATAGEHSWHVVVKYQDEGSASRFATKVRKDWQRLLADIAADKLDVIILWETSRGSRRASEWMAFLELCLDHNVLIHITTHQQTYDMHNARQKRTLQEDGVDNEYEVEKTSGRVRRTTAANRLSGKPTGRINFGFERIYDERTRRLVEQRPLPAEAAIVNEIITRIANHTSISELVRDLNARNVPTSKPGGRWGSASVRRIVFTPAYVGKVSTGRRLASGQYVGGQLLDAGWPAIVDEEDWWAAQRVLSAPERKTSKPGNQKWLLSCLMTCSLCGGRITVHFHKRAGGRRVPVYLCSAVECTKIGITMESADEYVEAVVKARVASADFRRELAKGSDAGVIAAQNEAEGLRAQLRDYTRKAAREGISADSFALYEAEIRPLIEAAEQRAIELAVPLPLRALVVGSPDDVEARWEAMDMRARREVVKALLAPVRLHRVGKGRIVPAADRITFRDAEPRRVVA
jgi:DNA invertase Pin-like site-specific DNA recombinase